MATFGRSDQMPPDVWQVLPQQQHQRGGGPSPEGMGDNTGAGGESRSRSSPGPSTKGSVKGGRGKNPGRGYRGDAPQPGGKGAGFGAFSPGGNIGAGADVARERGVKTGFKMGVGLIGTLLGNIKQSFENRAIVGEVAQEFGLDAGLLSRELGLVTGHGAGGEGGETPMDTLPGEGPEGTPGQEMADTDDPEQDLSPEEKERRDNIRRGLDWYTSLMGSWAPGADPVWTARR